MSNNHHLKTTWRAVQLISLDDTRKDRQCSKETNNDSQIPESLALVALQVLAKKVQASASAFHLLASPALPLRVLIHRLTGITAADIRQPPSAWRQIEVLTL